MANPVKMPTTGRNLVEQLKEDTPAVYDQLVKIHQDTPEDYRSKKWYKRHPSKAGLRGR